MVTRMAGSATFPLYDRLLDGHLTEILERLLADGLSIPQVRDRIRDEHKVDVSDATVRRWIADLDKAAS